MKLESKALLEDLEARSIQALDYADQWKNLSLETLNWRESEDSWSILECIEHLNRYSNFYIPEIESRIKKSSFANTPFFKPGLLGNYFAQSMLPKEKLNKMKTFKSMNPMGSNLNKECIHQFISYQKSLLEIINQSKYVDLNKVKTSISISKWIKLKLGDTLRVVVFHNQRHIVQASKVLELASVVRTTEV